MFSLSYRGQGKNGRKEIGFATSHAEDRHDLHKTRDQPDSALCLRRLRGWRFCSFQNRGISSGSAAAELLHRLTANCDITTKLCRASARIAVCSLPTRCGNMRMTRFSLPQKGVPN